MDRRRSRRERSPTSFTRRINFFTPRTGVVLRQQCRGHISPSSVPGKVRASPPPSAGDACQLSSRTVNRATKLPGADGGRRVLSPDGFHLRPAIFLRPLVSFALRCPLPAAPRTMNTCRARGRFIITGNSRGMSKVAGLLRYNCFQAETMAGSLGHAAL